jgi:hypothetical protein
MDFRPLCTGSGLAVGVNTLYVEIVGGPDGSMHTGLAGTPPAARAPDKF